MRKGENNSREGGGGSARAIKFILSLDIGGMSMCLFRSPILPLPPLSSSLLFPITADFHFHPDPICHWQGILRQCYKWSAQRASVSFFSCDCAFLFASTLVLTSLCEYQPFRPGLTVIRLACTQRQCYVSSNQQGLCATTCHYFGTSQLYPPCTKIYRGRHIAADFMLICANFYDSRTSLQPVDNTLLMMMP